MDREQDIPSAKKGAKSVKESTKSANMDTISGGSVKRDDISSPVRGRTKPKSGKSVSTKSKGKQKQADVFSDGATDFSGADSAGYSGADSAEDSDVDLAESEDAESHVSEVSSTGDGEVLSTDDDSSEEELSSGLSEEEEEEEEDVDLWGEGAPLSEDTSCCLALCNMDWDHVGAKDVFGECTV